MKKNDFQFRNIHDIEEATFDKSLNTFYENGIEGTIKENIQNSLDARLYDDFKEPVKLLINLEKVNKSQLPGIDTVFKHINTLKRRSDYTKETIEYMKSKETINEVRVLTIEDRNTKGLTGAKRGQNFSNKDTFGIYAYKKGVHSIDENDIAEKSRGGSHGIGKIANNAASDIHLMYFSNCDQDENQHIGGTVHLIEHKLGEEYFRATGYYTDIDEKGDFTPYENQEGHEIFKKNTRGLKIIIPYLREEFYDAKKIIQAVCDNFFLAILNNSIIVEITNENNDKVIINSNTINNIVQDNQYYEIKPEEIKKIFTPLYVDTYLNYKPKELVVKNSSDAYKFYLYFNYNEDIYTGRVALLRTIGMKIVDLKVNNRVRKPFNAVLIGGTKEDSYLKSLENESHTDISEHDIRDKEEKKNARKFINNLHTELRKVIDEVTNEYISENGTMNTEDLFFETITSFKKDIEKNSEKVMINNDGIIYKEKNKKERRDKRNEKGSIINKSGVKRKRRPRKKKNDPESSVEEYIIPLNAVARLSFARKEIFNLNIAEINLDSEVSKCNLKMKVVDGSGITIEEIFNIKDYYENIKDVESHKVYKVIRDTIFDIDVKKNNVNLELTTYRNRVSIAV
ncbi:hypothetical protein EON06_09265 [Staphylococcus delphini]|uniref:hypothetical protein n=1 Tax=Staphylococcus delphini TaxID=53344 RepID=UPI0013632317|nr:hypothetical protein [Staphylococcus delphini]NBK47925.1 hypothetical protein [Staphylococcus delphini]